MKKMNIDSILAVIALILTIFALIIMSSLNGYNSNLLQYSMWIAISIVIMIFMQFVPVKIHFASSYILFSVNLIVLIISIILRPEHVLLHQFASQFLKLTYILFASRYISNRKDNINSFRIYTPLTIITLIIVSISIYLKQPSNAFLYVFMEIILLYLADMKTENIIIIISIFISIFIFSFPIIWIFFLICLILILYFMRTGIIKIAAVLFSSIISGIISIFIWAWETGNAANIIEYLKENSVNIHGYGWNLLQSKIAVG